MSSHGSRNFFLHKLHRSALFSNLFDIIKKKIFFGWFTFCKTRLTRISNDPTIKSIIPFSPWLFDDVFEISPVFLLSFLALNIFLLAFFFFFSLMHNENGKKENLRLSKRSRMRAETLFLLLYNFRKRVFFFLSFCSPCTQCNRNGMAWLFRVCRIGKKRMQTERLLYQCERDRAWAKWMINKSKYHVERRFSLRSFPRRFAQSVLHQDISTNRTKKIFSHWIFMSHIAIYLNLLRIIDRSIYFVSRQSIDGKTNKQNRWWIFNINFSCTN